MPSAVICWFCVSSSLSATHPVGRPMSHSTNAGAGRGPSASFRRAGAGAGPSGDVFPPGDGVGVASPALNSPSINDHSVSDSALLLGEPAGPWSAKSMIWCDSAIVPRRARTWSSVSPPRDESVASGVRNSAPGEDEDAEALVRSADQEAGRPIHRASSRRSARSPRTAPRARRG